MNFAVTLIPAKFSSLKFYLIRIHFIAMIQEKLKSKITKDKFPSLKYTRPRVYEILSPWRSVFLNPIVEVHTFVLLRVH